MYTLHSRLVVVQGHLQTWMSAQCALGKVAPLSRETQTFFQPEVHISGTTHMPFVWPPLTRKPGTCWLSNLKQKGGQGEESLRLKVEGGWRKGWPPADDVMARQEAGSGKVDDISSKHTDTERRNFQGFTLKIHWRKKYLNWFIRRTICTFSYPVPRPSFHSYSLLSQGSLYVLRTRTCLAHLLRCCHRDWAPRHLTWSGAGARNIGPSRR